MFLVSTGLHLAEFYLSQAKSLLHTQAAAKGEDADKQKLRTWLNTSWTEDYINIRTVQKQGPHALRTRDKAARAIELLEAEKTLTPAGEQDVGGRTSAITWRVRDRL